MLGPRECPLAGWAPGALVPHDPLCLGRSWAWGRPWRVLEDREHGVPYVLSKCPPSSPSLSPGPAWAQTLVEGWGKGEGPEDRQERLHGRPVMSP